MRTVVPARKAEAQMEDLTPIAPEPTSREPAPGSSGLPERFIP
jgi:hypothetical protein